MKKHKKAKSLLLTFSLLVLSLSFQPVAKAQVEDEKKADDIMEITRKAGYSDVLEINRPKASLVIDATSGQILWQDQVDLPHDPASIAKLMTVFLVLDHLEKQKISLDTPIKATDNDQAISQLYAISNSKIVAGADYPIHELLKMVTVPSSNVATVMLANYVSENDASKFIKQMNEKAESLEMEETEFNNCSGASISSFEGLYTAKDLDPEAGNKTSAKDLAIMIYHLLKDHPDVLNYTNKPVVTTMAGTPYEETFDTYNYSLPGAKYGFEGVDGLKTGSSPDGAFNYVTTAKRGDTRLIEVILGVGNWEDQNGEYYRHPFGNALLQKAFDEYETKKLLSAGKHTINDKTIILKEDFYGTLKKAEQPEWQIKNQQLSLKNQQPRISEKISTAVFYQVPVKKESKKAKPKSFFHKKHASMTALFATSAISFIGWRVIPHKKTGTTRRKRGNVNQQVFKFVSLISLGSALALLWHNFL